MRAMVAGTSMPDCSKGCRQPSRVKGAARTADRWQGCGSVCPVQHRWTEAASTKQNGKGGAASGGRIGVFRWLRVGTWPQLAWAQADGRVAGARDLLGGRCRRIAVVAFLFFSVFFILCDCVHLDHLPVGHRRRAGSSSLLSMGPTLSYEAL
jgi:hypothetical protein